MTKKIKTYAGFLTALCTGLVLSLSAHAQGTRLLRQPTLSDTHIAFVYGGDIWASDLGQQQAVRITSTAAVESEPHFSPDGKTIAFTSNRSGTDSVYTVSVEGGPAQRLTWHPASALTRGWTPDGEKVLYASSRETAPIDNNRLWTVPVDGGAPTLLSAQWGYNGSFSAEGNQIVIDRMSRWDTEWRAYRGGQNTSLLILDLEDFSEIQLPNNSTTDVEPLWIGENIYFLSDRDWTSNVWSYSPDSETLQQITDFEDTDIKQLSGNGQLLTFERDGYLHTLDPDSGEVTQLEINVSGDFPWAETQWEDVSDNIEAASLSPTGKRAIMSARGEVFTVPVEFGTTRNITQSSDAADRAPLWSPLGDKIAWFSDVSDDSGDDDGYSLLITNQDGLSSVERISIGESKMAWEPSWSPDGQLIAFVDDDVRIRIIDLETEDITTIDIGGTNLERGSNGLTWSGDSNWLAYTKTGSNGFRRITVWSRLEEEVSALTNAFADAFAPAWDRDGKHLYFLASTDVALATGWANTSSVTSQPVYGAYIINLTNEADSPFNLRSDEESGDEESEAAKPDDLDSSEESAVAAEGESEDEDEDKVTPVLIDFEGLERRILAMPVPQRNYRMTFSGPAGTVFIGEQVPNSQGLILQKFSLEERKAEQYADNINSASVSADGNSLLVKKGNQWQVLETAKPNGNDGKTLQVNLNMNLDRVAEWTQIFEEAWRYERDYFYDPNLHGRDWDEVYRRYAPLAPFIRHRSALTYIMDQVGGELSVGHSFVFGGDYPEVEKSTSGLLGADLVIDNDRWKFARIYTTESWNPELTGPLDQPGLNIENGYYLVGINGRELSSSDNPYAYLNGTAGKQTVLHINDEPEFEDAWQEIVEPINSESALRQRTWVEDNRRLVDELSDGKLAYIWVPNTSNPGLVSFNRYFFAQQDKQGAVIDERFNSGGLLDDYMVDLMTRSLRAGATNEVPNGAPLQLPAGILGPKVLLVNELAGSGGDYFAWVFKQQQAGPLIGSRTWGGLVKSSVHYAFVDGGAMTAPDNSIFDPINNRWIAENEGIAPDIEVYQDARSLEAGEDPQLLQGIAEALRLLEEQGEIAVTPPPFLTPAIQ